jgi:hypothetical protein
MKNQNSGMIADAVVDLMQQLEPEKPIEMTDEKRQKLVGVIDNALAIVELVIPPLIITVLKEIERAKCLK